MDGYYIAAWVFTICLVVLVYVAIAYVVGLAVVIVLSKLFHTSFSFSDLMTIGIAIVLISSPIRVGD